MKKTTTSKTITALSLLLLLTTVNLFAFNPAHAQASTASTDKVPTAAIPTAIKAVLSRIMPGRQADSIRPSVIADMYEVIYGTNIFYLTADGKHLLQGDIYALDKQTNLTEATRSTGRSALIAAISPASMIIFKPLKTRHVVTIFTDIDCGYCRKLHSEIDSYMAKDIEIRYLAFPRSGVNTRSYFKAVAAWCADDRQQALTSAKSGNDIGSRSCEHPVDQHMATAAQLGITGTPTMVFADGTMLPGYVPADRLEQYLTRLSAPKSSNRLN